MKKNAGLLVVFICMVIVSAIELSLYGYLLADLPQILQAYTKEFVIPTIVFITLGILISIGIVIYVGRELYRTTRK